MEKSKVYYSDFRALPGTNLQQKFAKLLKRAGIGDIDMNEKSLSKFLFCDIMNMSRKLAYNKKRNIRSCK